MIRTLVLCTVIVIAGCTHLAQDVGGMQNGYTLGAKRQQSLILREEVYQVQLEKAGQAIEHGIEKDPAPLAIKGLCPNVMFINDGDYDLRVQVTEDTEKLVAEPDSWLFTMTPGQILVFPDDSPQAPRFKYFAWYTVAAFEPEGDRTMRYGKFYVRITPKWENTRGVNYHGGFSFVRRW